MHICSSPLDPFSALISILFTSIIYFSTGLFDLTLNWFNWIQEPRWGGHQRFIEQSSSLRLSVITKIVTHAIDAFTRNIRFELLLTKSLVSLFAHFFIYTEHRISIVTIHLLILHLNIYWRTVQQRKLISFVLWFEFRENLYMCITMQYLLVTFLLRHLVLDFWILTNILVSHLLASFCLPFFPNMLKLLWDKFILSVILVSDSLINQQILPISELFDSFYRICFFCLFLICELQV